MQFARFALLVLAPLALAIEQHRNATAAMAMDQGVFDGLFAVLNPLSPNAAKSKEVELKFGPMVARTRNCQYDILYALWLLGTGNGRLIERPDKSKFNEDDSVPPTEAETKAGGSGAGAGAGPLAVPLPVPVPGLSDVGL